MKALFFITSVSEAQCPSREFREEILIRLLHQLSKHAPEYPAISAIHAVLKKCPLRKCYKQLRENWFIVRLPSGLLVYAAESVLQLTPKAIRALEVEGRGLTCEESCLVHSGLWCKAYGIQGCVPNLGIFVSMSCLDFTAGGRGGGGVEEIRENKPGNT